MEGSGEARRQREQLDRYLKWVEEEGGVEGPTHLDTWFKPKQQNRLAWLKKHCVGTVMELGTCYGYVLAYCGGQIGVDWNEKSIALARILNPSKEFVVADIRNLPFPNNHVDTVMACDCLEHIPWEDVPKAVSEARRVAKEKVLITLPDPYAKDNSDAINFKHRWLATQEKVRDIMNDFSGAVVKVDREAGFVLMDVCKEITRWRQ